MKLNEKTLYWLSAGWDDPTLARPLKNAADANHLHRVTTSDKVHLKFLEVEGN